MYSTKFHLKFEQIRTQDGSIYTGFTETLPSNISPHETSSPERAEKMPTHFGRLEDEENKSVYGEFKMGRLNGLAEVTYSDGKVYFGSFYEDMKSGLGRVFLQNKVYLGVFSQNERTGPGVLIELKEEANGEWMHETYNYQDSNSEFINMSERFSRENNQLVLALGKIENIDFDEIPKLNQFKQVKIGEFKNGCLDGYGEYFLPELEYLYRGIFKEGYPHTVGQEFSKTFKFRGQFKKGQKHGIGVLEEFSNSSQAKQKSNNSNNILTTFSGNWINNEKHGYGIQNNPDRSIYEGLFSNNEPSGVGRLLFQDENCFVGQFQYGKYHGFGKLTTGDFTYIGGFHKGRKQGLGYLKKIDSFSYLGYWQGDRREGIGYEVTKFDEFKGEFSSSVRHGKGVLKQKGRKAEVCFFDSGKKIGVSSEDVSEIREAFNAQSIEKLFGGFDLKIQSFENTLKRESNLLDKKFKKLSLNIQNFDIHRRELSMKITHCVLEMRQNFTNFQRMKEEFSYQLSKFCADRTSRFDEQSTNRLLETRINSQNNQFGYDDVDEEKYSLGKGLSERTFTNNLIEKYQKMSRNGSVESEGDSESTVRLPSPNMLMKKNKFITFKSQITESELLNQIGNHNGENSVSLRQTIEEVPLSYGNAQKQSYIEKGNSHKTLESQTSIYEMETDIRNTESIHDIAISVPLQTPKHLSSRNVTTPIIESKYLTSQFLNLPNSQSQNRGFDQSKSLRTGFSGISRDRLESKSTILLARSGQKSEVKHQNIGDLDQNNKENQEQISPLNSIVNIQCFGLTNSSVKRSVYLPEKQELIEKANESQIPTLQNLDVTLEKPRLKKDKPILKAEDFKAKFQIESLSDHDDLALKIMEKYINRETQSSIGNESPTLTQNKQSKVSGNIQNSALKSEEEEFEEQIGPYIIQSCSPPKVSSSSRIIIHDITENRLLTNFNNCENDLHLILESQGENGESNQEDISDRDIFQLKKRSESNRALQPTSQYPEELRSKGNSSRQLQEEKVVDTPVQISKEQFNQESLKSSTSRVGMEKQFTSLGVPLDFQLTLEEECHTSPKSPEFAPQTENIRPLESLKAYESSQDEISIGQKEGSLEFQFGPVKNLVLFENNLVVCGVQGLAVYEISFVRDTFGLEIKPQKRKKKLTEISTNSDLNLIDFVLYKVPGSEKSYIFGLENGSNTLVKVDLSNLKVVESHNPKFVRDQLKKLKQDSSTPSKLKLENDCIYCSFGPIMMFYSISYQDSILIDVTQGSNKLVGAKHLAVLYNASRKTLLIASSKVLKIGSKSKKNLYLSKLGNTSSQISTNKLTHISKKFSILQTVDQMTKIDENLAIMAGKGDPKFANGRPSLVVFSLNRGFKPICGKIIEIYEEPNSKFESLKLIEHADEPLIGEKTRLILASLKTDLLILRFSGQQISVIHKYKVMGNYLCGNALFFGSSVFLSHLDSNTIQWFGIKSQTYNMDSFRQLMHENLKTFSLYETFKSYQDISSLEGEKDESGSLLTFDNIDFNKVTQPDAAPQTIDPFTQEQKSSSLNSIHLTEKDVKEIKLKSIKEFGSLRVSELHMVEDMPHLRNLIFVIADERRLQPLCKKVRFWQNQTYLEHFNGVRLSLLNKNIKKGALLNMGDQYSDLENGIEFFKFQRAQNLLFTGHKNGQLKIFKIHKTTVFTDNIQKELEGNTLLDTISTSNLSRRLYILKKNTQNALRSPQEYREQHDDPTYQSQERNSILIFRSYNISLKMKSLMIHPEKLELNFNQNIVFVAGRHKKHITVTAFEFNRDFLYICEFKCSKGMSVISFQRLFCSDIFLLCTETSLYFIKYNKEQIVPLRCMQLVETLSSRNSKDSLINKITGVRVCYDSIWVSLEVEGSQEVLEFCFPNQISRLKTEDLMRNEFVAKGQDKGELMYPIHFIESEEEILEILGNGREDISLKQTTIKNFESEGSGTTEHFWNTYSDDDLSKNISDLVESQNEEFNTTNNLNVYSNALKSQMESGEDLYMLESSRLRDTYPQNFSKPTIMEQFSGDAECYEREQNSLKKYSNFVSQGEQQPATPFKMKDVKLIQFEQVTNTLHILDQEGQLMEITGIKIDNLATDQVAKILLQKGRKLTQNNVKHFSILERGLKLVYQLGSNIPRVVKNHKIVSEGLTEANVFCKDDKVKNCKIYSLDGVISELVGIRTAKSGSQNNEIYTYSLSESGVQGNAISQTVLPKNSFLHSLFAIECIDIIGWISYDSINSSDSGGSGSNIQLRKAKLSTFSTLQKIVKEIEFGELLGYRTGKYSLEVNSITKKTSNSGRNQYQGSILLAGSLFEIENRANMKGLVVQLGIGRTGGVIEVKQLKLGSVNSVLQVVELDKRLVCLTDSEIYILEEKWGIIGGETSQSRESGFTVAKRIDLDVMGTWGLESNRALSGRKRKVVMVNIKGKIIVLKSGEEGVSLEYKVIHF